MSLRRHLQIRTFAKQPSQSSTTRPINKFVNGYTNNFLDTRLNSKNDKLNSSSHTDNKKNLAVIDSNQGKFQTNANNTIPLCPTNVGGPGDKIAPTNKLCCNKSRKLKATRPGSSGVRAGDNKHNSYDRYLARKKGYILQKQHC